MSSSGSGGVDRASLMSEKDWLLKSVEMYDSGPSEMAISLGKYIRCGGASEVRWFRMYQEFPDWQHQSGLLTNELHKDVVETQVLVFCTLIVKPRCRNSRKALRGGAWENKGRHKPKAESRLFDMTKLYYPKDGFTVIEYVQKIEQPHVAICVLHRKGYANVNRDLLTYACESVGRSAPLGEIFMSPCTNGLFNDIRSYETSTMSGGLNHTPWQNSMTGPPYSFHMNDIMSVKPTSIGYADASAGNSMMTQENTCTMNDNPYTAMLPEPKALADEMSMQNDPFFTSFLNNLDHDPLFTWSWNNLDPIPPNQYGTLPEPKALADEMSMQNDPFFTSFLNNLDHDPLFTWSWNNLDPIPPNQYATTGGNEPRQPDTTSACVNHLMGTTSDYAPDEHFPKPMPWEHNSTFETDYETLLEPSPGEHQDGHL